MKFCSLFSGSSGNSLFISEKNTRLLVDAGLSGKRIERALSDIDELPALLSGILVTHEHRDHIQAVGILSRRYDLPIYANAATWQQMAESLGKIAPKNQCLFETGKPFAIGDLAVEAFPTSHDAAEPVGFTFRNGRKSLAIATDTGIISPLVLEKLKTKDLVVIESNHDPSMLETGSYPYPLKQRIKGSRGHLSNEACADAVCQLVESGVDKVILAHLSRENNYPLLAYQTNARVLAEHGITPEKDLCLTVADRDAISNLYEL